MCKMNRWLIAGTMVLSLANVTAEASGDDVTAIWSIDATVAKSLQEKNMADVSLLNESLRANCPSIVDLAAINEEMDGQWVREMIDSYQLPSDTLFSRGKTIQESDRKRLTDNRNLAPIGKMQSVGYGIAVRRANVKALPTGNGLFLSEDDVDQDILQQGALDPCEVVRLLHVSQDRRYYFVQGETVKGWVFIGDIAVCKKSVWERFYDPGEYLVVTARGIRINQGRETIYLQMGTRLPLISVGDQYKVRIPLRGNAGKFTDTEVMVDKSDAVEIGYLSYDAANLKRLARAYVGAPYGVRGLKNSEDMVGMLGDVYRTMGIVLPRNRADYEKAIRLIGANGAGHIVRTTEGRDLLVLAKDGDMLTVIAQSADGKQFAEYTVKSDAVEEIEQ